MTTPQPFTPPHPLNTAVLFLVFNRLDTTKQVFEAIRQAKPPRLYIAADGARETKEGEAEKVQAVRDYVMENIDWDCEVKTLFREKNLGCKYAVSGAITWFFENEEQGIILEDDCLPSQSFFWYCEELLNKYKYDETIYIISGDGRPTEDVKINGDYTKFPIALIWGWASWASAWQKYDVEMGSYERDLISEIFSGQPKLASRWLKIFDKVYSGKIDTWDYQLSYLLFSCHSYCIVPRLNMIENIGFGMEATHTYDSSNKSSKLARYELLEFKSEDFTFDTLKDVEAEFFKRYLFSDGFFSVAFFKRLVNYFSRLIVRINIFN